MVKTGAEPALVLFGGSFDPIHIGHLRLALEVAKLDFDAEIAFLPCARNALKAAAAADAGHRLAMLELALAPHPQFSLLRDEVDGHSSCTCTSLQRLRSRSGGERPIFLLLGVDSYNSLAHWRQIQLLPGLCNLLIVNRPGYSLQPTPKQLDWWQAATSLEQAASSASGYSYCLNLPELELASSQLRADCARGARLDYLLPRAVIAYIREHQLYGG